MRTNTYWLLGLALVGLIGCSDHTVRPQSSGQELTDQMADLTLESDLIVDAIVGLEMVGQPVTTADKATNGSGELQVIDVSFSRSRSCPAGGTLEVTANMHRTYDPQTLVMEAWFDGTRTRTACAFVRGEFTITVDGSSSWEAFRRRVDGTPDGPQSSRYSGSFTAVRSDGEQRTCTFDVEIIRDPGSRTRNLDGTFCGTRFSRSMGWNPAG